MGTRELILHGGEAQISVEARLLRLNDTPDGKCVTVSTAVHGVIAVLDRNQMHMLALFLQERLDR